MAIAKNTSNAFVPLRECRETTGTLNALNSELVLPLNGDQSVLVTVLSTSLVGTLEFTSAGDAAATTFLPVPAYPMSPKCVGGTIPLAGQPLLIDALVAANTVRVYSIPVGQQKALRVRMSAYASGSVAVTIVADVCSPINTAIEAKPSTLLVTATGAAGAAVTATLPAVAGLRHIVDFIRIVRSASVALTAGAVPTVVTTTNLPGALVATLGASADLQGVDRIEELNFGSTGSAATALGTATTVVCPATTGVIWRVIVAYRLGL
jgi:hypothetical protein